MLKNFFGMIRDIDYIARDIFGGDVSFRVEYDPEIEDCYYLCVDVTVGAEKDLSSLRREFYSRTTRFAADGHLTLSVSVV